MDWTKVGAIGSALGGIFAVLVFAATVWPWPQIKARKNHTETAPKLTRSQKLLITPLVVSLLLSTFAIYAAWKPALEEVYIYGFGTIPPNLVMLTVDTSGGLKEYRKTHRIMTIGRAEDSTIDAKKDTMVIRSATFEITGGVVEMEACLTQEKMRHAVQVGNWMQLYLVLVPNSLEPKQIKTLEDAEAHDAKILRMARFYAGFHAVTSPTSSTEGSGQEEDVPCQD